MKYAKLLSDNELKIAKTLFIRYNGDSFHLTRETNYYDFNVPESLEQEWFKEIEKNKLNDQ